MHGQTHGKPGQTDGWMDECMDLGRRACVLGGPSRRFSHAWMQWMQMQRQATWENTTRGNHTCLLCVGKRRLEEQNKM
eukprot:349682-Chlamydomonas_euryale.AAC.30